jgi:Zn-dependent membrane protease YugP
MFYMLYDINPGLLVILAAFVIGLIAKGAVNVAYRKYSRIGNRMGFTGAQIARQILDNYGLAQVGVERSAGSRLSDHYDPRTDTLSLSSEVHDGRSVAALGVAAHEAGHAVQDAMGYRPFRVRNSLVPIANLGSQLLFPLIFAGFFFRMANLFTIGAILYGAALAFQLVTLPVEFDASRRAVGYLEKTGMPEAEMTGVKKVLTAAAMTYVAAALAALGQMVWLILAGRRR